MRLDFDTFCPVSVLIQPSSIRQTPCGETNSPLIPKANVKKIVDSVFFNHADLNSRLGIKASLTYPDSMLALRVSIAKK